MHLNVRLPKPHVYEDGTLECGMSLLYYNQVGRHVFMENYISTTKELLMTTSNTSNMLKRYFAIVVLALCPDLFRSFKTDTVENFLKMLCLYYAKPSLNFTPSWT
jgi:hypothetical protein